MVAALPGRKLKRSNFPERKREEKRERRERKGRERKRKVETRRGRERDCIWHKIVGGEIRIKKEIVSK